MKQTIKTLNSLADEIRTADWGYDRSDDYRVYSKGLSQCDDIIDRMRVMEFDNEDTFYLEKKITDSVLKPEWTDETAMEVIMYWSRKIGYLTRK